MVLPLLVPLLVPLLASANTGTIISRSGYYAWPAPATAGTVAGTDAGPAIAIATLGMHRICITDNMHRTRCIAYLHALCACMDLFLDVYIYLILSYILLFYI